MRRRRAWRPQRPMHHYSAYACAGMLIGLLSLFGGEPRPRAAAPLVLPVTAAVRTLNPVTKVFAALSRCRPSLPERQRWRIAGVICEQGQRYGYDPLFVVALAAVESQCSPTARSSRGAIGLLQVKPSTARALLTEEGGVWRGADTLTRPVVNLRLGLRYLALLERRFGDPYVALAAYNLGPTRVARMPRRHARRTRYVRAVLARYDEIAG